MLLCIIILIHSNSDFDDLSVINTSTVVSHNASKACVQLIIHDDDIPEDDESFTLILLALDQRDTVNGTTSIIISDNDGKDYSMFMFCINYCSHQHNRC